MADELDGMAAFVAVAEAKGFRAAGERLYERGASVAVTPMRLPRILLKSASAPVTRMP